MPLFAKTSRLLALLSTGLIAAGLPAAHASEGRYLNWQNKAPPDAAAPSAPQAGGSPYMTPPRPLSQSRYNIPASPYGQVGVMTQQPAQPAVQPVALPQQPISAPPPPVPLNPPLASLSSPQPMRQPAPVTATPLASAQTAPQFIPQSAPQPAQPPRPAQTPTPTIAQSGGYTDSGYQVPASSPYAARIAAARAAQQPGSTATAPASSTSLAEQDAATVFIPGEQALNAGQEPRYYSLHRQYGLDPDPIPPSAPATGGILATTVDFGGDDSGGEDGAITDMINADTQGQP